MARWSIILSFIFTILFGSTSFAENITKNVSVLNDSKYPIKVVKITVEEKKPEGKKVSEPIKIESIAPKETKSASITFPVNVPYKVHIDFAAKFYINDSPPVWILFHPAG